MAEGKALLQRFDMHDADWVCLMDEVKKTPEVLASRGDDYLSQISRAALLVEPPDCLSVWGVAFAPGYYVRTHYHDVDQFLLVTRGEFRMGSRTLRAGHGTFIPADNSYNAHVGKAGGCFLEFREGAAYRTAFSAADAPSIGPGAPTEIPGWSRPGGKRRKTTFFDAETCPPIACTGFGPGDLGRAAPAGMAAVLRYQALHLVPGDGYSMISVATDQALRVPRHHQDADRVIYVVAGELQLAAQGTPLRAGAGVLVPAWTPLEIETGPAGGKYLEFRTQSG